MSGECDKYGDENVDEIALEKLEEILIRLRQIKLYVGEQKEKIEKGYSKEEQGYYALRYLYDVLLAFVKEKDDD